MGRSCHLLTLGAVLLALAACRGNIDSERASPAASVASLDPTPPARGKSIGPPRLQPKCIRPLEEYCLTPPCPTYESALRKAVEVGSEPSMGVCLAHEGECGPLRFVSTGDGYTSATGFFDKSGRLVAGRRGSDTTSFCDRTSFTVSR